MKDHPFPQWVVADAAETAVVDHARLVERLSLVQAYLLLRLESYRRTEPCVFEDDDVAAFVVDADHWTTIGDSLGFDDAETAVARATHERYLHELTDRTAAPVDRETALADGDCVVIGKPASVD